MKHFFFTAITLVCIVLVISLVVMKQTDNARHQTDVGAINDFSNRLDSAHTQLATYIGMAITLSNRLDESQSASLTFSNQLNDAQSAVTLYAEQITNLTRQVATLQSENQTLQTTMDRRVLDLTNRITGLTKQIASTETNLNQANKNYALLENRLRRDVAARVILERKFNNPSELKTQMENLKVWSPGQKISAENIYADLNVEVDSDGTFHAISPN